jgi:hypothetical protein
MLESSQVAFTKYFFRVRGETFIPGDHHALIDDALTKLERGELYDADGNKCTNLLITIAPRYGKTQIAVIDWMARSIAKNPRAKFIHLSYSDDLALDNSSKCRETVASPEYQALWPVKLKADSDSKKKWYTTEGGGVYASSAGGPVTGFGAGSLVDADIEIDKTDDEFDQFFAGDVAETDPDLFYGAIVIDDPIKIDDADREKERDRVNKRLNSTIKSRRNSRKTPIVITMQRSNEDDMAGFVLAEGIGERFYELKLPAIKPDGTSLWPHKHTIEELMAMKKADNATFMAQYMQDPTPEEGVFFKKEWFDKNRFRIGEEPTKLVKYGAGDYAVTPDSGDWSEQAIAGFDIKEDLWFMDWWSGQVTLDKSIDAMMRLAGDHDPMLWVAESGVIRRAMEPFLLKEQQRRRLFFKLEWLAATKSKSANAKSFQALASQGKVHIPFGIWGDDLIAQLLKFSGHEDKRDDKVDVCGLFGRLLGQAYGPAQYHEELREKESDDDYGVSSDDGGDDGDWRTA